MPREGSYSAARAILTRSVPGGDIEAVQEALRAARRQPGEELAVPIPGASLGLTYVDEVTWPIRLITPGEPQ